MTPMLSENSRSRVPEVKELIALFEAAGTGQLDGLQCPRCGKSAISVWFTHTATDEYRTWLICENCDFETRAQNIGLPPHYSEDRDRTAKAPAP